MSIKRMNAVWEHSAHKGNALLLLLKLADNASDDGYCWPGIDLLAERTRVSTMTVIRLTRKIEESGELFVQHNRRSGNKYVVRVGMSDEEVKASLTKHFPHYGEEDITNILLRNTCVSSEVTHDVSSEVTPMLDEPSRTTTEPPCYAKAFETCPTCGKPRSSDGTHAIKDLCQCTPELDAHFGPREKPPAPESGHWLERIQEKPWRGWSDGRFSPRPNASIDSQERVAHLVEEITHMRPTEKEWKHWSAECAGIYEAGRGDWDAIKEGIQNAWDGRDPQYRPRNIAGFKGEVQLAYAMTQESPAKLDAGIMGAPVRHMSEE